MDDKVFDGIAENVVLHVGERLRKKYPNAGLDWKDGWRASLRTSYDVLREQIRGQMFASPGLNDHRIDRHKVAAAFTRAIMEARPLKTSGNEPSEGGRLANEALAFLSGVRIVQRFLVNRFKAQREIAEKIATTLVRFPPANDGDYPVHAYKAFHNAGHAGLNVFVLSNLYFLIESFHLQTLGIDMPVPPEGKEGLLGLLH